MTRPTTIEPDKPKLVSLRRVSGAGLANVSYLVIQSLLFVVMTPLVLKALGLEVYGLWTIMTAITGFANLGNFGIGAGVTKFVSEFSVMDEAGARISGVISFSFLFLLASGILTGLLIFLLRHRIAVRMVHHAGEAVQLADALAIISWGIAIVFLMVLPKAVLFGLVYHKVVGAIDMAQSVAILGAALIIGLNGGGIVALALSLILINLVFLVILIAIAIHVTRSFALHFTLNRGLTRKVLQYSSFAFISGLGNILFNQGDRILVGMLLGPATAGAYAICTGVAGRLNALTTSTTLVLIPFASSYLARGKIAEIAKVYLHLLRLNGCLLAAMGVVLIVWGKWLLSVWISSQFSLTYSGVFTIIILAYALYCMVFPGYYIAFGLGRPEVPALANIGGALIVLILISILAPVFGLTGAALANISYSLELAVVFFTARQLGLASMLPSLRAILPSIAILIMSILIVNIFELTIFHKLAINMLFLIMLSWLAFNDGRLTIVLKAIKSNSIG